MSKILRQAYIGQRWQPQSLNPVVAPPPPDPREEFEAIRQAALDEATAIRAAAVQEAEALRQEAYAEGLARGEALAEQHIQAQIEEVQRLVAAMNEEHAAFFDEIEPEVVRLAVTIAEKVLAQQISLKPEIVVDLTRTQLKRLRERGTVHLYVNPDDYPLLNAAIPTLGSESEGVRDIVVYEDRRVGQGGVVLETSNGSLDARLTMQIEVVRKALYDAVEIAHDPEDD